MEKQNCWEYTQCGREPGGAKTGELGVCKAATESRLDGLHGGKNAGRACWALGGTLCGGQVQGIFALKLGNCMKCSFYGRVLVDEGMNYVLAKDILPRL